MGEYDDVSDWVGTCERALRLNDGRVSLLRSAFSCIVMAVTGVLCPYPAWGQSDTDGSSPDKITRVIDYWLLDRANRSRPIPVEMEFQVLHNDPFWNVVQIKDNSANEYIEIDGDFGARAGNVVRVSGYTLGVPDTFSFKLKEWVLLGQAPLEAEAVRLNTINHAAYTDALIEFEGLVEQQTLTDDNHLNLVMVADGQRIRVVVLLRQDEPLPDWRGALVKVTGVHAPKFDSRGEVMSLELWCAGTDLVEWLGPLEKSPVFDRPLTPTVSLLNRSEAKAGEWVRVAGELIGLDEDGRWVLQDEATAVLVHSAMSDRPNAGDSIEVVGVLSRESGEVVVEDAWWRPRVRETDRYGMSLEPTRQHRIAATVLELTPKQATQAFPVDITGVVTWSDPDNPLFYMEDSTAGLGVRIDLDEFAVPPPGTVVRVQGSSRLSTFAPQIDLASMEQVALESWIRAKTITRDQALSGVEEGQFVRLRGFVFETEAVDEDTVLRLSTYSGEITARVTSKVEGTQWLGAVIDVQGVCVAHLEEPGSVPTIEIWVARPEQIDVVYAGPSRLDDLPTTPIADLGLFNPSSALRYRVKVSGTVLWTDGAANFLIHDGERALQVQTRQTMGLEREDLVEAAGFLGREGETRILRESVWRVVGQGNLPVARRVNAATLRQPGMVGQRVVFEAKLLAHAESFRGVRLRLDMDGRVTTADIDQILDIETIRTALPVGALVQVTGIAVPSPTRAFRRAPFEILIPDWRDVVVLEQPAWWSAARLRLVGMIAVFAAVLALGWGFSLRRMVARQGLRIQDQLKRARELQTELDRTRRMESLGSMADGISRDFAQLLKRIDEQIEHVMSNERFGWESRKRLDQGRAAVLRAQDLLRRLSSLSLSERPAVSPVDFGSFVRREVSDFEMGPLIKIEWSSPATLPLVRMDEKQMRIVLRNLLRNAIQAMPEGGTLKLQIMQQQIFEDDPAHVLPAGPYLCLVLGDEGEGMTPEQSSRAFDPYYTTRQSSKGLGLSVAYSIVQQHRGRLVLESQPGEGTTVWLWLPVFTDDQSAF